MITLKKYKFLHTVKVSYHKIKKKIIFLHTVTF